MTSGETQKWLSSQLRSCKTLKKQSKQLVEKLSNVFCPSCALKWLQRISRVDRCSVITLKSLQACAVCAAEFAVRGYTQRIGLVQWSITCAKNGCTLAHPLATSDVHENVRLGKFSSLIVTRSGFQKVKRYLKKNMFKKYGLWFLFNFNFGGRRASAFWQQHNLVRHDALCVEKCLRPMQ